MRDRVKSERFLIHHFSHTSEPGTGQWFPWCSIARKSAMLDGMDHWKGSFLTRLYTSVTEGVDSHGLGTSGVFLLKPLVLVLGPRWRIRWYVGVYQSRDETGSLCRPDLYSSNRCKVLIHYSSESSSLYTCNTSWRSVHYMILNKPLVRLTTVHYQSAVSMISFAQVSTAQWSNTIPCRNVRFLIGIISHNILFQHSH